jgi:hypothetical protein
LPKLLVLHKETQRMPYTSTHSKERAVRGYSTTALENICSLFFFFDFRSKHIQRKKEIVLEE